MLCASSGVGVPRRLLVCPEHVMVAVLSCCCLLRNKKAILSGRISGKAHGFHFQFELFCVKTKKGLGASCRAVILNPRARVFPHLKGKDLW